MNDRQINQVFSAYKEATAIPDLYTSARRRRLPRLALVACTVVALLGIAGVALWPKESLAAAVARMDNAITNVESMRAKVSVRRGGRERHIATYTYWKGLWRYDNFVGTPLESVVIYRRDDMVFHERNKPYATIGKPYATEVQPARSALEYVKSAIDYGEIGVERTMKLVASGPINRRPTFTIVATRPNGSYHAEIVVDAESNLPIRATAQVLFDDGQRDFSRWEFEWNVEISEGTFSAERLGVPVIDRDSEVRQIQRAWSKPIAVARIADGESRLRNVFVANDGTVFLAYTRHPGKTGRAPVPMWLSDDAGNVYARAAEYGPGAIYGRNVPVRDEMALDGGEMFFAALVPADGGVPARHIDVHWQQGPSTPLPASTDCHLIHPGPEVVTTIVASSRDEARFPPYSPAMVIDHYHNQKWTEITRLRAELLFKLNRFEEAADWGWEAYDSYTDFIPRLAYRELTVVIKSLDSLGRTDDANEVRRRVKREKDIDEAYMRQP